MCVGVDSIRLRQLINPDSLLAPIAPSEIPRNRRRSPERTPLAASGAGQTPRVVAAATSNEAALGDIPGILLLLYDWLLGINRRHQEAKNPGFLCARSHKGMAV